MFSTRTNWKLTRNRLTDALEETKASGAHIADLTISNPTRAGLHYDQQAILQSLASPNSLDYDPQPKGLPAARAGVAAYYRDQHQTTVDIDRLILATSTSEGYSFVFRLLCNPGDEILVPKPSYPLFEFLADLEDVKLVPYPLLYDHGWQIDFHSLQSAVSNRTRAVVVVHPNNPTGSFVHCDEQAELNRICHEYSVAIIADEVFLDYSLAVQSPLTFAANHDALTFTLSGLSKIAGLPQMKIAWIAASGPPTLKHAALGRLEVIADTYLSMNAPIQLALAAMLDERKTIQPQLVERVRTNLAELDAQLSGQKLCHRLQVEGGWYAIVRVPARGSDEDLAIALLEQENVLIQPGHFYDFAADGHLVVSLITPVADFAEGMKRLLAFVAAAQ
jgi:alanine-synthesizing transaminase